MAVFVPPVIPIVGISAEHVPAVVLIVLVLFWLHV